jgi:hypothetical protein
MSEWCLQLVRTASLCIIIFRAIENIAGHSDCEV